MAGVIALTGTETKFGTLPSDQGGSIVIEKATAVDFDPAGVKNDKSYFVETAAFVDVTAREHGISPRAALVHIIKNLNALLANPNI